MFSLQSDFLRHSLLNLLGAAELRTFFQSHAMIIFSYLQLARLTLSCSHSPRARLRRIPSKNDSGRLNLPMSLNLFLRCFFSSIFCSDIPQILKRFALHSIQDQSIKVLRKSNRLLYPHIEKDFQSFSLLRSGEGLQSLIEGISGADKRFDLHKML
jgi:hypothetical protein